MAPAQTPTNYLHPQVLDSTNFNYVNNVISGNLSILGSEIIVNGHIANTDGTTWSLPVSDVYSYNEQGSKDIDVAEIYQNESNFTNITVFNDSQLPSGYIYTDSNGYIIGSYSDNYNVDFELKLDGNVVDSAPAVSTGGSISYQMDLANLGNGTHNAIATFNDENGNVNSSQIDINILNKQIDNDYDGIPDLIDNCPHYSNPDQMDFDGNGIGYECDWDEQEWLNSKRIQKGSVMDAPHNNTYGIKCSDCHSYASYFQYSPIPGSGIEAEGILEDICNKCHDITHESHMISHNKSNMGSENNNNIGDWSTSCVSCHDPHKQPQLEYLLTNRDELYLVEGTIGAVSSFRYDELTNETSFELTNVNVNNSNYTNENTWINKNGRVGNGLIIAVSSDTQDNTYKIVDVNNSYVTVKGFLDVTNSNVNVGLFRGNYIKNKIYGRDVKFFDPDNGDLDRADGGLCNVCHEDPNLKYHNNTGTGATHYDGTNCLDCHTTDSGFKPPGTGNTGGNIQI